MKGAFLERQHFRLIRVRPRALGENVDGLAILVHGVNRCGEGGARVFAGLAVDEDGLGKGHWLAVSYCLFGRTR